MFLFMDAIAKEKFLDLLREFVCCCEYLGLDKPELSSYKAFLDTPLLLQDDFQIPNESLDINVVSAANEFLKNNSLMELNDLRTKIPHGTLELFKLKNLSPSAIRYIF